MRLQNSRLLWIIAALSTIVGVFLIFFFLFKKGTENVTHLYIERKLAREAAVFKRLADPSEAPESIRKDVQLGFQIFINTKEYAGEYVGGSINCTNCHFAGGNTTGGAQGGLSLVGVATQYPSYDQTLQRVIDLPRRINNCFTRSLNGKLVPCDSDIMLALITYLQWISKDLPIYKPVPWLGIKQMFSTEIADPKNGKKVYSNYCATCHGNEGEGGTNIPPLWGDQSFNNKAGFNRLEKLAPFIYWNMPYFDSTPILSEQEAFDVASYILSKPRPIF